MPARRRGAFALIALLAATANAGADGAQRIARISEQIDAARFDEADSAVRAALGSGELERRELSRVHLLAGVIASARRDESGARASFRRALSLDPEAALPGTAGPHVSRAFEEAKLELGNAPALGVTLRVDPAQAGRAARVHVSVKGDSERLAHRLRVESGSYREERPLPPHEHEVEVPAPSAGCNDTRADVVDRYGNRLWSASRATKVCAAQDTGEAPSEKPSASAAAAARPIGAPIWIGLGLTAVGLATTGVLGLIALDRRSEYHSANSDSDATERERRELFDDASAAERRATIAAIATGVVGATTLTLFLLRPGRSSTEVGMRAHSGGATAIVGGRF